MIQIYKVDQFVNSIALSQLRFSCNQMYGKDNLPTNCTLRKGTNTGKFKVGKCTSHVRLSDTEFDTSLLESFGESFQFSRISINERVWVIGIVERGRETGMMMSSMVSGMVVVEGLHLMVSCGRCRSSSMMVKTRDHSIHEERFIGTMNTGFIHLKLGIHSIHIGMMCVMRSVQS